MTPTLQGRATSRSHHLAHSVTPPPSQSQRLECSNTPPSLSREVVLSTDLPAINQLITSNYKNIPVIGEDALLFSPTQLQHILQRKPRRFQGIDFLHLDDNSIF